MDHQAPIGHRSPGPDGSPTPGDRHVAYGRDQTEDRSPSNGTDRGPIAVEPRMRATVAGDTGDGHRTR
ncbi:hypothetical protein [Halorubrum sp. CBA1125]|uniref:hypothetical protein n=1 Tax=Halorubrum sp. CBA1125 TaxID=2668072 RepID=UPI0012E75DCF|nr:hypothetical protein [Halorubrum sp. CBA1125]